MRERRHGAARREVFEKEHLIMSPIQPALLNELLKGYEKPEELLGQNGLLQQLTKALVGCALDGESTHYLRYEKHDAAGDNSCNSTTIKPMKGKHGQVQITVPRDRNPEFEPQFAILFEGRVPMDRSVQTHLHIYETGTAVNCCLTHFSSLAIVGCERLTASRSASRSASVP
jgi:putative transposase